MGKTSKDQRDIYYRMAKEQGWRARSAFKLLQIDDEFKILENVTKVVDLCAAPGSWSQVLSKRLLENGKNTNDVKIVAVDLQPMSPINGVIQIRGDITDNTTAKKIIEVFGTLADLVVCDGAPDVTGLHSLDEYMQSQLVLSALNITTHILKRDGSFVAKRLSSYARDTRRLMDMNRLWKHPLFSNYHGVSSDSLRGVNRVIVPFVACGDLSGFDSDGHYDLNLPTVPPGTVKSEYVFHNVVQPPTEPAYKTAVMLKKQNKLDTPESIVTKVIKSIPRFVRPVDANAGDIGYGDEQVEGLATLFSDMS